MLPFSAATVLSQPCTTDAFEQKTSSWGAAIFSSVTNDESKCFFKPNYPIKIAIVTITSQDASFMLTPKNSFRAAAATSCHLPRGERKGEVAGRLARESSSRRVHVARWKESRGRDTGVENHFRWNSPVVFTRI